MWNNIFHKRLQKSKLVNNATHLSSDSLLCRYRHRMRLHVIRWFMLGCRENFNKESFALRTSVQQKSVSPAAMTPPPLPLFLSTHSVSFLQDLVHQTLICLLFLARARARVLCASAQQTRGQLDAVWVPLRMRSELLFFLPSLPRS